MNVKTLLLAVLSALIAACNSHTVVDRYHAPEQVSLKSDDAIVLLGRATRLADKGDSDFVDCVGNNLDSGTNPLRVLGEAEFVDAMYPWFESTTAPTSVTMLGELFKNEAIAERLDKLAVKYLVWIEGQTETLDSRGGISCTVSPGGGGCFGFKSWDDEAEYTANVWDLDGLSDTGKIGTRTSGTSYVPAFILPVPLLARVKSTACEAMADQIADHFMP